MPLKKLILLLVLSICIPQQSMAFRFTPSKWDKILVEARQFTDTIALKNYLLENTEEENESTYQILYNALMAEYYIDEIDKQDPKIVSLYNDALSLAKSNKDDGFLIWIETQLGFYYYRHNQYEKALTYFNKTTRALENSNSQIVPEKASVYKKNAYFFQTIKNYPTAIALLKEALQWCETTCSEYNSILFSLGCNYLISDDYQQAQYYLEESRKVAIQNNDELQYAKATGELGLLHRKLGDLKLAKKLLKEDIEISDKIQEGRNSMYARIHLGTLLIETKELENASLELHKALDYAQSKEYLKGYEYDIYKLLLQIAQQLNNTQEEISIRRHLDELSSLISDTESEDKVNQLKWQAQNEQIKWQLSSSSSKLSKAKNTMWYATLSFIGILGIFIYLYISNRKKSKIQVHELDEMIAAFQREKSEAETHLNQTTQSLSSYQQYLEEKNIQIKQLQKELKNLKKANLSTSLQKQKTGIEDLLNSHLMTDENWGNFKNSFIAEKDIVYNAIKDQLPDLTESNLRMVMLHVLGLNNTQIANTLGITNEAVKKSKQRMRKKYGNQFDDLLESFQKLENQSN